MMSCTSTDTPIRVAHLITPSGIYGAERWVSTVVRHLNPARVDARVVLVGDKPGLREAAAYFRSQRLATTHIPHNGKLNPVALLALASSFRRDRIEVVHSHGFKSDVLAYLAGRSLALSLVTTPHGWSADEGKRIAAYEHIGRVFMRRFDRIYPLSRSLHEDLLARGFRRDRVRLVFNAVDDTRLAPIFRARRRGRGEWPPVLVFIGRLCAQKGVFELLDAFAAADLPEDCTLLLAGAGPAAEEVTRRIADLGLDQRVRQRGYVEDVAPILRRADAVVLPSHSEGLPRVLMEACAAGVPVIATDIPGVRELITHEHNGLLVPLRNAKALAGAMERVYREPALVEQLVRNGRETIERAHTASRQARRFENEYHDLVRPHETPAFREDDPHASDFPSDDRAVAAQP